MKITTTLFFLLILSAFSLSAQSLYGIKGSVGDSASNSRLVNTTICVLNAKDSTLVAFTRANATGAFAISNLKKGKFILLVTYPEYADYTEMFHLDSVKTEVNFGKIDMRLKSRLLKEVMIKGAKDAIKIKGDTTEYNASSFVIQPNSKVEDLLKQLPGISVDKDGKITAQGQAVSKVLVDGEEFFGDDPTLVTKNIRGDMVDKVQVYDKKSDQATFTGIDDGVKNKTINIKLKEDKKNGYFGKIEADAGLHNFYEEQIMFNLFKAKQKFSTFGTLANTGKIGLGWEDANKYGSGNNNMSFGDDGSISITSNNSDAFESFDGNYDGHGLPVARTGGMHYDTKWNADKESINGNYKIGYLDITGTNGTITQNSLPTTRLLSNLSQDYNNSIFRNKADAAYTLKIDSLSNLKVTIDGTIKNTKTNNAFLGSSYHGFMPNAVAGSGADTLLNTSNRKLVNEVDAQLLNASIFYNKKFKKPGRSFSWNLSEAYNASQSDGTLNSVINFYNPTIAGKIDSTQLINQKKTSNLIGSNLTSNITYSEPITKNLSVIANYGTGLNNSTADRKSFDQSTPGNYNVLDPGLSNDYAFNQFSNQLGAAFNYNKDKTLFTFGTKATAVQFKQTDKSGVVPVYKRDFLNWNPALTYRYKFSQYRSVYFNYSGSPTQPTIDQIQPIVVNTDPLNITLGNPDLKPSFRNNFNFSYNSYKVISGQSLYLSGNYSLTSNPIVSNTNTDATGKTTFISQNLTTKTPYNVGVYLYFDQKIKKINLNVGANASVNGNTSYSYANGQLNAANSYNYSGQLSLSSYKEKKYDFWISAGPTYTHSVVLNTVTQAVINNNGLNFNGNSGLNFYLPAKFRIGTDENYQYKAATQSFNQDFSRLITNAYLAKTFLKQDALDLSVSVADLFNQNAGFTRTATGSSITQSTYTTIRRLMLFSIKYDFSKMGGASVKK